MSRHADVCRQIMCMCHHAASHELVVMACTTRIVHKSMEHEDGGNGSECRSCGSCIDASRRRRRGCMRRRGGLRDALKGSHGGWITSPRAHISNGEPPQSLSPYPQAVIHPLQTSGKCNRRPLRNRRPRPSFTPSPPPYRTRSPRSTSTSATC